MQSGFRISTQYIEQRRNALFASRRGGPERLCRFAEPHFFE